MEHTVSHLVGWRAHCYRILREEVDKTACAISPKTVRAIGVRVGPGVTTRKLRTLILGCVKQVYVVRGRCERCSHGSPDSRCVEHGRRHLLSKFEDSRLDLLDDIRVLVRKIVRLDHILRQIEQFKSRRQCGLPITAPTVWLPASGRAICRE